MTPFHGVWLGLLCSVLVFLFLGGRVLTHGIDLRKNDSDGWKEYVYVNLVFNFFCGIAVLVLFCVY